MRSAGFEDVQLVHCALPELDMANIDLGTKFLGKWLGFPFLIASMTGGHAKTKQINANLAKAVEEMGIGMGVGSQRAALEDDEAESFTIVRDLAPTAFIYANIGISQLDIEKAEKAIEMIDADAIAVHLNFLQEVAQPEGDEKASGCLDTIRDVCEELKKPVIAKETGAGISYEVACKLANAGVSAIDVGGFGGTNWAVVEMYRGSNEGNVFKNWGIPTVISTVECSSTNTPVVATGGIRNGLHIAKSIVLGAHIASAALPLLKPALRSEKEIIERLKSLKEELKTTMFLLGRKNVEELRRSEFIAMGKTKSWLEQRGFLPLNKEH